MKKSYVLIAILAVALIFPFALNVEKADADAILFPWITKSDSVSTVLSVVNTAQGDGSAEVLHYQYWYKKSNSNGQAEKCDNISFKRSTSKDDIVTFDAAGNMNSGKALFNDPGAGTWKGGPTYGNSPFDLNVASPRRAFLLVDNNTDAFVNDATNEDGTLYGEAMIIELGGGAAWGYIAYNAIGGETLSQNAAVLFEDGLDVLGEVIGISESTQTVLLAPDTITTRFFMTPVNTANQRDGDTDSSIQLCIDPDNAGGCDEGGIFDNDENKIDFEKEKAIACTSADNLVDLMTEASFNTFQTTGGQGWSYIVTTNTGVDSDVDSDGMVLGKLEYTTTGVTFDDVTVPGTLNNFVWLRDNESLAPPEVMISMATLNDWINNGYNNGVPDTFGYQKMAILSVQKSDNYGAGHPTGAYLWDQIAEGVNSFRSDGIISVKYNVLTKPMMDDILERAGIDADTVIVVTGDSLMWIGRTYFNLRYWGFPRNRLRVANGVLADFPGTLTTVVPAPVGSGQSVCNLSQAASVDEVRASLAEMISVTVDSDPHTVPLDVRSANEWNGLAANNVAFRGHMKTAVWNEWKNQTTNGGAGASNQIKDAASLITIFNGVGITSADTSYIY